MPVDVKGLFHPVIAVSDMREAVAYYQGLLGLSVTFDDYHEPAAIQGLFGYRDAKVHAVLVNFPDGSEFELVEFERPRLAAASREPGAPGLMAVNLQVAGIEELAERLASAGYPPRSGVVPQTLPDGGQIKVCVCSAPDDVALILVELPPGRTSLAAPAMQS